MYEDLLFLRPIALSSVLVHGRQTRLLGLTGKVPLVYSSFSRPNGSALNGTAPQVAPVGSVWEGTTSWLVNADGEATYITDSAAPAGYNLLWTDAGASDVILSVKLNRFDVVNNGVVLNFADTANYWYLYIGQGSGNMELYSVVAGVESFVGSNSIGTLFNPGDVVSVKTSGDDVEFFRNNVKVGSTITVANRPLKNNTKHGLYGFSLPGIECTEVSIEPSNIVIAPPPLPVPMTVPGSHTWLRADAGVSLDETSGVATVAQWLDQSGNGHNAVQTAKTRQPKVITSTQGTNHKTLEFPGNSNGKYLILDIPSKPIKTAFIVWRSTADFNDYNGVFSGRQSSGTKPEGTVTSTVAYSMQGNASGRVVNIYSADQTEMSQIRFNGVEQNTFTARNYQPGILPVGTPAYAFNTATLRLSTEPGGFKRQYIGTEPLYSRYFQGEISEILLYENDLSQADILKVEGYLQTKYGHY